MLAHAENARLAEVLLADTAARQGIACGQLTIHADRGSPMTAKPVALLLAELGVTKSHSRPHVSNDNPYSESQFRTMKYRPTFPDRFGSYQDAHAFCGRFFRWYNDEHRHSGIGFHTPADVHYGRAELVRAQRADVLGAAYAEHPERFVASHPSHRRCRRWCGSTSRGRTRYDTVIPEGTCLRKVDTRRSPAARRGRAGEAWVRSGLVGCRGRPGWARPTWRPEARVRRV